MQALVLGSDIPSCSVIHIPSFPDFSVFFPSWPAAKRLIKAPLSIPFFRDRNSTVCACWETAVIHLPSFPEICVFRIPPFPEICVFRIPPFPEICVFHIPPFPEICVFHIPPFPDCSVLYVPFFPKIPAFIFHHFRIFPSFISHHFRKFRSFMFHHFPVLAGRKEFDPGLFSLETETQRYVLLGITFRYNIAYTKGRALAECAKDIPPAISTIR